MNVHSYKVFLPEGLHVEKNFILKKSCVDCFPEKMFVGRNLYLDNIDILEEKDFQNVKGDVFVLLDDEKEDIRIKMLSFVKKLFNIEKLTEVCSEILKLAQELLTNISKSISIFSEK